MAIKVLVYPIKSFFYAFLSTKDIEFVDEFPQVLHYFGSNIKELKRLIRKTEPDLLVTHLISTFKEINIYQIYHPLQVKKDLITSRQVWTNRVSLCKHYYSQLGYNVSITEVEEVRKKKKDSIFKIYYPELNQKVLKVWNRFKGFMKWH